MDKKYVKIGDNISAPSPYHRLIDPDTVLQQVETKRPSFSIAHITDIHIKNNATCISRLPVLKSSITLKSPNYIIASGDLVDSQAGDATQISMLGTLLTDLKSIVPTYTARGNHDCALTNVQMSMPANYYYFDINKWRFIVLFSQQAAYEDAGNTYTINADWRYGATQIAWLSNLLSSTPADMFVCVVTHVPIVGVGAMLWWINYYATNPVNSGTWNPTVDQMKDVYTVMELFRQYPNVKLSISGHEHIASEEKYLGVTYLNSGAVCANWWNDTSYKEKNNPAGYRMINFFDDGTFTQEFITY